MFDLNAYLMNDANLTEDCVRRIRAYREQPKKASMTYADELVRDVHESRMVQPIKCADGLSFSAQAGGFHYSSPKQNEGPWVNIEIGFPNRRVEEFMPYAESPEDPTGTVYGHVPVEIVEAVVDKHGGIV